MNDYYLVPADFIELLMVADGNTAMDLIEKLQQGGVEIKPCSTSQPLTMERVW